MASTYVKLGMVFRPNPSPTLTWYVNGVKCANTKAIPNATSTDFPATVRLGRLFGQKLVNTAAGVSTMDWWGAAQLF